jgi:hypothetical protein
MEPGGSGLQLQTPAQTHTDGRMTTPNDVALGIDEYRRRTQIRKRKLHRGSRRETPSVQAFSAMPRANERWSHQLQTPSIKSDRLLGHWIASLRRFTLEFPVKYANKRINESNLTLVESVLVIDQLKDIEGSAPGIQAVGRPAFAQCALPSRGLAAWPDAWGFTGPQPSDCECRPIIRSANFQIGDGDHAFP